MNKKGQGRERPLSNFFLLICAVSAGLSDVKEDTMHPPIGSYQSTSSNNLCYAVKVIPSRFPFGHLKVNPFISNPFKILGVQEVHLIRGCFRTPNHWFTLE